MNTSNSAAAVICEYNPFHNGHKFQTDEARRLTGCDCVVGLMSGNYVQRGDFAIFPKELRARAALECGVDLIIENPSYSVLRSAEGYAFSSVYMLNRLNSIDFLVFGAECDSVEKLYKIADFLVNETNEYKNILLKNVSDGMSFAAARGSAVGELYGEDFENILKQPNNLLAVEYIKAIIRLNSPIKPILIQRKGAYHGASETDGIYASASCVRERILNADEFAQYVPKACANEYNAKAFDFKEADKAILSSLCLLDKERLKKVPGISEGLENKIKKELFSCESIDELTAAVKSKRYAYTRIRRALLCAYLGMETEEYPEYVKINCFNEKGRAFLNSAKKTTGIILAKNASPLLKNKKAMAQWRKEAERDRVYEILYSASARNK